MRFNMKMERLRRDLTIREVSKQIGVHENAIARWEKGVSEPTSSNLVALCELYECSPEYLLDLTNDRNATAVAP